ncbi:DUF3829 domain-containing protein [Oxalobacter formigenes]|uniref:DUF3829 domain-containing protein n=1 Tax=Oxalobacter formigenes TaxID=847 RepID=UPI00241ECADF|nr:DUF3829 domain-containing protein [Oxalobacter formigenes]
MRIPAFVRLFALAAFTLSLSGCVVLIPTVVEAVNQYRLNNEAEGAVLESNTGALKLVKDSNDPETGKLNDYISGYNSIMVGNWSLWPSWNTLTNHTMKAKPADTISFPVVAGLEKGITSFKKGLAVNAQASPELNAAVTAAVTAGEKLLKDERSSLPYFRDQVYRRDNLDGGRVVLPILKADYTKLIDAMNDIGAILIKQQRAETLRRMDVFKSQRNMVPYYAEQSLLYGQDLVTLFNDPENSVADNAKYVAGDKIVASLELSLKNLKKSLEADYPKREGNNDLDSIISHLEGTIKVYRFMKEKKTAKSFNLMMKRYSNAVESYNRILKFTRPV